VGDRNVMKKGGEHNQVLEETTTKNSLKGQEKK
jgi:hypothetical protein